MDHLDNIRGKIASAIVALESKLDFSQIIMPLGLDGAILYHFMHRHYDKFPINEDHLGNIIQFRSDGRVDRMKMEKILQRAQMEGRSVYGLDMRTKRGTLGKLVRSEISSLNDEYGYDVGFRYSVAFDPCRAADIRGTEEELGDNERSLIKWLPNQELVDSMIVNENGMWIYHLTHQKINNFAHVKEIMGFLK